MLKMLTRIIFLAFHAKATTNVQSYLQRQRLGQITFIKQVCNY